MEGLATRKGATIRQPFYSVTFPRKRLRAEKAGPLPKKESRPILCLPLEPQKCADRHDVRRCLLFRGSLGEHPCRYRGPHMPAREELLRPLLEQIRCGRGSLIGGNA
jgi:hypothetical protein